MLAGIPSALPAEIPKTSPLALPGIQVEFKIPSQLGTLEEFRPADCLKKRDSETCSPKTVIYIQDAHDSLEVQENIAGLIQTLVSKYGVKTVLEEGYEGPVPTDYYFGAIQDSQVRRKVAYFLMDKLRLGGAEYAHITRFDSASSRSPSVGRKKDERSDFKLIGADSLKLHRENIKSYQESAKHREETAEDLREIEAQLRKLTQLYFTQELRKWMEIKEKLDQNKIDLLNYLKRTQVLFLKDIRFGPFRKAYPNISLLLSAAETQDPKVLRQLKTSVNYKTLFQEINRLEDDYAETHLAQERDRQVFRYYKLIQLLKRLNNIEVTEEEYAAVKETLHLMNTGDVAQFIAAQTGQSLVLSRLWENSIQSAVQFYEIARERDGSIQSRLEEYASNDDPAPVVLVYGGFHKGQIKELLEQTDLTYAVVCPRMSAVSPKHQIYYQQLMHMGYDDSMALPKLAAIAASPPRFFDLAAVSVKNEVRLRGQLEALSRIAQKDSSPGLGAVVGAMDLDLSRQSGNNNEAGVTPTALPGIGQKSGGSRSEVRSALEGMPEEWILLRQQYHGRRLEIISDQKDQDYQKAQKHDRLVREIAGKIYALAAERFPATHKLAVMALADMEVPAFAQGRILRSPEEEAFSAADFVRDAAETIFGKPWEILEVKESLSLPVLMDEDSQFVKMAEQALEFSGEHWIGGSEALRIKRREQYGLLIRGIGGLKTAYESRRARIWNAEGSSVNAKMLRHAELADEMVRELYRLAKQFYPEQSGQLALIAYGGQGRREMHLSSDSEGRILLQKETDAPEAGRFLRNATEWVFGKGSRWLLMLADDPIEMIAKPGISLDVQQKQITQATELLDARTLAGNSEIVSARMKFFQQQLKTGSGLELAKGLIDIWNGRYREAGFIQGLYDREPDVKEGIGGLRTLHFVRWIAQAYTGKQEGYFEALIQRGLLKKKELEQALTAYEFLNKVRGGLGREKQNHNDPNRLTMDVQNSVAYHLGYQESASEGQAVDQLLRDYDKNALVLFRFSYKVIRRISESEKMRPVQETAVSGDLYQGKVKVAARRVLRSGYVFQLSRGFREISQPKTFLAPALRTDGRSSEIIPPESMMPLFLYAVENKLKFTGELLDVIEKSVPEFRKKFLSDEAFQRQSRQAFMRLLEAPHQTAYALERMHLLKILPILIPGFKKTGFRARLEMDYRTTLDWYALQSVDALDKFMSGQLSELEGSEISEAAQKFFKKISKHPALLRRIRLALLLQKFDEASLKTVMEILKLSRKTTAAVEWLRKHHNDLNELIRHDAFWQSGILPKYVESEIGQNQELWLFFIGASLARLYALRPEQFWLYLEAVEPAFRPDARLGQPADLAQRLAHERGAVNKLMQLFFGGPREDKKTVVLVEPFQDRREGSAKITVYHRQTEDLPGRLEKIAGIFAASGLLIESETVGDILGENVLIDRFIVTLPPMQQTPGQAKDFKKVWHEMEKQLNENIRDSLERDIPVSRIFQRKEGFAPPYHSKLPETLLHRPTVIAFNQGIRAGNLPSAAESLTTLRVETADRPMLLYVLTKIIAAHGVNIHAGSTIDTEGYDSRIGKQAVDTFILSLGGEVLTTQKQVELLRDLHFWLNRQVIDLIQLDRHRELMIYKNKLESYLSHMKDKTAGRLAYVGDIHGDFDKFNKIVTRLQEQGVQKTIFMGDYIDHGPQSRAVLEALRKQVEQGKAVALMGNHEMMFMESVLGAGSGYSRRFDLWLRSGGWAFLREFFGNSLQGVDISEEGVQNIKFGHEDFFTVFDAVKRNKDLIEIAQWMKANLRLFYEDNNMGFSVHARFRVDAGGELVLDEDSAKGRRRGGREVLDTARADWQRGDPGDELRQGLLDERVPLSGMLLGAELPADLLQASLENSSLQNLLTGLRSLRIFNGHIEPGENPNEHLEISKGSAGIFNPIDYGIRKKMGGYVVSNSEGIRYFLFPPETANAPETVPAYSLDAAAVIKQAEEMLAFTEQAIWANSRPLKSGVRSEVRMIPQDLIELMPPRETRTLQPLNEEGRQAFLQINRNSFAEHFARGSKNLEALSEALTKNYERRPNQRSLFIDLPEPFEAHGRRWVRLQLKGIMFDARQKITAHSEEAYQASGAGDHAMGFVDDRLEAFPEGYIGNVGAQPSPDGAMIFEKAIREFAVSASINANQALSSENFFAPGAVAYGEFPGLLFDGHRLGFVVLGIDDEMVGAVTRMNESSSTVTADVTRSLLALHQEGYTHPFLHGGNLSTNAARTKWYVHDLDASRLLNPASDSLRFAEAAQMRDLLYLVDKYVFDRYLSQSHEDAAAYGFRHLQSLVETYFPEQRQQKAVWETLIGDLIPAEKARVDGGLVEVLEHYLRQLDRPGKSVSVKEIISPRGFHRPLIAGFEAAAFIEARLRRKNFNDVSKRSEVRGVREVQPWEDSGIQSLDESIYRFWQALVSNDEKTMTDMITQEWHAKGHLVTSLFLNRETWRRMEVRNARFRIPEAARFAAHKAGLAAQVTDRLKTLGYPELSPAEHSALGYAIQNIFQHVIANAGAESEARSGVVLVFDPQPELPPGEKQLYIYILDSGPGMPVKAVFQEGFRAGTTGFGSDLRSLNSEKLNLIYESRGERYQAGVGMVPVGLKQPETGGTLVALRIGVKEAVRRSEMRSHDSARDSQSDAALAREYDAMQTFESEAQRQREAHAQSPRAFLLKPRDLAAERAQLENKFGAVVFVRDWIGLQSLSIMVQSKGGADWKALEHPVNGIYPGQAALEGLQLNALAEEDAPVDFLFRAENNKIILELRNAQTHRSLGGAKTKDLLRHRFTPAGQALIRQLQAGNPREDVVAEAKKARSEVRRADRPSEDPRQSLEKVVEKAGPAVVFVDVTRKVKSSKLLAEELARLSEAGSEVVPYDPRKGLTENKLVRLLKKFPKIRIVPGSFDRAVAGFQYKTDTALIHYSAAETDHRTRTEREQAWTKGRVIYLAGEPGSAAYGLGHIKVLRKAVEAEEIEESLLTQLEIAEKNGFYFVSESKSAWMRLQLEAESIVAFAQAA